MKHRILLKIGGRAFEGEDGFRDLSQAITSDPGIDVIIVHGGGAEISQALKDAGRQTEFIDGIRITRAGDIKIVENVLSGKVNQRIADWLNANGVLTQRLSGKSEQLFMAEPLKRNGRSLGYVGRIKQVNPTVVEDALERGCVPVVSPISADENGASYNVNADSAAAALAAAVRCTDLIFITDVPGVMIGEKTLLSLTINETRSLINDGTIKGGMVAKMESAFAALENNVASVHIIQWQGVQTLQGTISGKGATGTVIQRK